MPKNCYLSVVLWAHTSNSLSTTVVDVCHRQATVVMLSTDVDGYDDTVLLVYKNTKGKVKLS